MPTTPQAQDYGEPWRTTSSNHSIGNTGDFDGLITIHTRDGGIVTEYWNPEDRDENSFARIVECVSACASITDPQQAIAAAREALLALTTACDSAPPINIMQHISEACEKARAAYALLQPND